VTATPAYIHVVGMACPLGLTAVSAGAAMRAGLDQKRELPYRDNEGRPIVGSFLESLGADLTTRQRWLELLALALQDLLRQSEQVALASVPIVCALPAEPNGDPPDSASLAEALSARLGEPIEPGWVRTIAEGACGGYRAIEFARTVLLKKGHPAVVVCAADTLVTARTLLQLSDQQRLLTESNSDGVIPGEAAACLLLSLDGRGAQATIRGIGFGHEPGLLSNDIPLRGDGVVAAARAALAEAGLQMHDADLRLSDAAGESYHFKEQVLVVSRLLRQRKEAFPMWLGASYLGDVGAAAGLCNLAWFLHCQRNRATPGRVVMAWAGQDGAARAALVVEARDG
jgi:3-oxoacyl-[acyl-carrier-protein] synthase I